MFGGLGEKTISRGFNRATQACRQTGSATKPIAVLAPGIDKKLFTAATVYGDEPTTFNDGSDQGYSPKDNDDYIGDITVRRAVESSQNIPFVKMMEQVTPQTSIKYLKKMGVTSLTKNDENLSLSLGGLDKGITPIEMAAAYATIANDGIYIEPTFYTDIVDSKGKTILKTKQKKSKVFSKEVAYILKDLLKQPVEGANGTAKACKIDGMDVAAKTGTTNDNYDKWLCGFTTYYTAVTWYGYDIGETVAYRGKSPAVLLWSGVMKNIHANLGKTTFSKADGVKQAEICAKTGNLATSNCSETYTEYFLPGTLPSNCFGCAGLNQTVTKNNTKINTKVEETTNSTNESKKGSESNTVKNETIVNNTNNSSSNNTNTNTQTNYNKINTSTNTNSAGNTNSSTTTNSTKSQNTTTNTETNTNVKTNTSTNTTPGNSNSSSSSNLQGSTSSQNQQNSSIVQEDDEEDDGP